MYLLTFYPWIAICFICMGGFSIDNEAQAAAPVDNDLYYKDIHNVAELNLTIAYATFESSHLDANALFCIVPKEESTVYECKQTCKTLSVPERTKFAVFQHQCTLKVTSPDDCLSYNLFYGQYPTVRGATRIQNLLAVAHLKPLSIDDDQHISTQTYFEKSREHDFIHFVIDFIYQK